MKHFLLFVTIIKFLHANEWTYQGEGIDYWIEKYPKCAGVLQSPIDIKESKAIYNSKLDHINFHNYEWPLIWNVSYNGYTISINQLINKTKTPYITGSDFKEGIKYYLKEFHFHWGFNVYQGSEHLLDGEKFPLEVHFVHVSESNEIAVIGFLFQIDNRNNDQINDLISEVGKDHTNSNYSIINLSLNSLVPDRNLREKDGYFRYMGSLTTPPCTEGIIWTIFRAKINISEAQMEQFYKNEINFNNREIQELNNRALYISVKTKNPIQSDNFFIILIRFLYDFFLRLFASLF